jgi:5-methylcytosine-specific restriction endonuclease McrA
MPYKDIQNRRAASRRHYRKSGKAGRLRIRARKVKFVERNREHVYRVLLAHPCTDCGETDPIILEFDHVRGTKVKDVAKLIDAPASLQRIDAEISKCEVVCANCHKRRTNQRGDFWKHRMGNVA